MSLCDRSRHGAPPDVPAKQFAPTVVAWSIMTLTRQLGIHDRRGAPDVPELAQLIQELVLGALDVRPAD